MNRPLDSPVTEKHSKSGGDARLLFGISEMQGWRPSMEDTHAAVLDLDEGKEVSNSFFAVYDGHNGSHAAEYAEANVHKRLVEELSYKRGSYELAMKRAFLRTDDGLLMEKSAQSCEYTGCTAIAALVTTDGKIYVANAGDSGAILCVKDHVRPLNYVHKPTDPNERYRIYQAGGFVRDDRVNGNLSLSRAIGDFQYKTNISLDSESQVITANPDIQVHEISENDEFLVIACDGIFDCLSGVQVADFIRHEVSLGKELAEICENICEYCLAPQASWGRGPMGCDNMTIMIIAILHGRTKEGWYEWVKEGAKADYEYPTPDFLAYRYDDF